MTDLKQNKTLYHVLRISVAMCFIGHGSFGIITKPIWCNYFAVFGIGHELSYQLMPIVGFVDVLLGISMLVYPVRAVAFWLVIWGMITALLRPLSGEPFAEFLERAGNFGAPLSLLLLVGWPSEIKQWFTRIKMQDSPSALQLDNLKTCLRFSILLLLAGHGWLNISGKQGLIDQYNMLGFGDAAGSALTIGVMEIAFTCMIFIRPLRPVVFVAMIWKITSEFFYPNWLFFEWIERGGSYGVMIAMWLLSEKKRLPVLPLVRLGFK